MTNVFMRHVFMDSDVMTNAVAPVQLVSTLIWLSLIGFVTFAQLTISILRKHKNLLQQLLRNSL